MTLFSESVCLALHAYSDLNAKVSMLGFSHATVDDWNNVTVSSHRKWNKCFMRWERLHTKTMTQGMCRTVWSGSTELLLVQRMLGGFWTWWQSRRKNGSRRVRKLNCLISAENMCKFFYKITSRCSYITVLNTNCSKLKRVMHGENLLCFLWEHPIRFISFADIWS